MENLSLFTLKLSFVTSCIIYIPQILMLKNKIYKYFFNEIFKNFITILLTFTTIAWSVKAVNFLDLMVEGGYNSIIYFKYSMLNITSIITRFVPLAFLLSLTVSIVKFERQQELLILWTIGLSKIKIVNTFLYIAIFVTFCQLILSLFVSPYLLNKSRSLLSESGELEINSLLRSNDFSDVFKGITFYIEKKNNNNELQNIFIKDVGGNLNVIMDEISEKKNTTIVANNGFVKKDKLILFNGMIQTLGQDNQIKNILFEKTELSLSNISTRTIKQPKIQETSSLSLSKCFFDSKNHLIRNDCSDEFRIEATQTLSRRLGSPLYIPLICVISSFLLIYKKEKKYSFLKKYILFVISFIVLIISEILLKYTGLNTGLAMSYFILPLAMFVFFYTYLISKVKNENYYE